MMMMFKRTRILYQYIQPHSTISSTVSSIQQQLGVCLQNERLLVNALVDNNDTNHEQKRLRFLGNTVWKLLSQTHVFRKHPFASTEELNEMKIELVEENHLINNAKRIGLDSVITQIDENPRRLISALYALIGASYLSGGLSEATKMCNKFDLCDYQKEDADLQIPDSHTKYVWQTKLPHIPDIERRIGYTFRRKQWLVEAFTHPAMTSLNYTRLAFIGDAVLDLIVTEATFIPFPDLSPSEMNKIRERSVNNTAYAFQCVNNSLHRFIICKPQVSRDIQGYCNKLERASGRGKKAMLAIKSPKVLGEVFEAVIGAVYVDSGNNMEVVKNMLRNIAPIKHVH